MHNNAWLCIIMHVLSFFVFCFFWFILTWTKIYLRLSINRLSIYCFISHVCCIAHSHMMQPYDLTMWIIQCDQHVINMAGFWFSNKWFDDADHPHPMQSACGHKTLSPHDSSSMNAIRFKNSHTSEINFIQTFQWTFPRHPYHAFMHKQQLDVSIVSSQLHLAMKQEQKAAFLNSSYDHNRNHTAIPFKLFTPNYPNNVIHICRVKTEPSGGTHDFRWKQCSSNIEKRNCNWI